MKNEILIVYEKEEKLQEKKKAIKQTLDSVTPQRIKALREDIHLTKYAAAREIGVAEQSLGQWENGKNKNNTLKAIIPDVFSLWMLADLFHVSIDYLVGRSDFTNIGNEEISEISGLSNDSIETIRNLSKSDHIDSKIAIKCINLLLGYSEFADTDLEMKDLSSVTNIFDAFYWYMQYKTEPKIDDELHQGIEYMHIRTIHNRLDEIAEKYKESPEFQEQIKSIKELITKRQNVIAKKKESRK